MIHIPVTEKLTIEKLHERLLAEGIPHEYNRMYECNPIRIEHNYLTYPSVANYVGDFVQHYSIRDGIRVLGTSYGADQNLMEGMGFDITPEGRGEGDNVVGWIDLEDAYIMIKEAMEKENRNR